MTPFGQKIRDCRDSRNISQKQMAQDIGVSPAYLSALEHGHRGQPSWALVQKIITYFDFIWDDAEELENLARLSHPRRAIDTSGLSPAATELINRLARDIDVMEQEKIEKMLSLLQEKD